VKSIAMPSRTRLTTMAIIPTDQIRARHL